MSIDNGSHIRMPGDEPCPSCGCPYGGLNAKAIKAIKATRAGDPLIMGARRFVVVASLFSLVVGTCALAALQHRCELGWWNVIGVALGIFASGHALGNVMAQILRNLRERPHQ